MAQGIPDPERERSERIDEILDALEAVPQAEREVLLVRVCPDPDVRREVRRFLAAESQACAYVDRFADELGATRAEPPDLSGRRIGAYRLLRPLGRGGMGVVYEAERADGAFEQRVALKLLTVALAGTRAHEWFLAERRILAGLKHPAIAHIVDGGVTEDGTPWFAMEHVEGESIDAYCDRQRLGIRRRLELFLQVCDAVEHAHRRLVVHRDLKPTNVLVTEDTQVKLLDFGIAKLLDAEGAPRTAPPTRTALRLMTPEYASPEQVRGEAVTTASDVYQLGLLLYELLTGHRPYVVRHRGTGELDRIICERPPARPSTALSRQETVKTSSGSSHATTEELCRARRASPARLRRTLRGELDNIVLKALSKEPERRYGSADRLAQDIRRYLEGLPVMARSDTWIYRSRKFLERHALGASTAAIVFVLVASLTGFYGVRIQSERNRAQAEAAKAQQMNRFLAGLLRSADPREARGKELTVREALDHGVQQVGRDLAGQPEVQADMLQVLGRTYLELGFFDRAESLLSRALELRRRRLGTTHPDYAETLGDLGLLRSDQGEYDQAGELLDEAIRILAASLGENAPELTGVLHWRAGVHRSLGELEESQATLERALSIQEKASEEDHERLASILYSMGVLQRQMGATRRAERLYERALAISERELGAGHPDVGLILSALANTRMDLGDVEGLEAMYRRSVSVLQNAYGPDHSLVAMALNNFGHFLTVSGRIDEAVDVLLRALEIQRGALRPEHPAIAYQLASLGDAYSAKGSLLDARLYYQQSVTVREGNVDDGQFDPVVAHCLVRLGRIEHELGNEVAAEQFLTRAHAIWRQAPDAIDPQLVPSMLDLGRWLTEQHRCTEAAPLLRRARQLPSTQQRSSNSGILELEILLADCSEVRGAMQP